MDSTDRSKQGGVDDAKQSASALNFDASSLSSDGTTLKISHDDNAPKPTPEPELEPQPAPEPVASEPVSSPEPQPLDHPTQPIPPAQPTGVPVNPLARKAPDFIGNSQATRNVNFANQTGDIMLQPAQPPKKSKTPLVIFGIILGLLVVAVIVTLTILNNTNYSSQASHLFNQYANYLLYEKESDALLEDAYTQNATYTMDFVLYNGDGNRKQQFFSQTNKKFNNFLDVFNKIKKQGSDLDNKINNYKDHFDLVYLYATTNLWDQNTIIQQYSKGLTLQQVNTEISKTYKPFIESSSQYAQQYGNNAVLYLKYLSELQNGFRNSNCLTNGESDQQCVSTVLGQVTKPSYTDPAKLFETSKIYTLEQCWNISKELREGA